MKTVIGIDPGLQNTGYGIIAMKGSRYFHIAHGTIITGKENAPQQRLLSLYQKLTQIVAGHKIDEAGIEDIYFAKNAKSAVPVAQAKGVILLVMAQNNIPVGQYSPLEIKRAVAGSGRAEKEQVQELVRMLLGLSEAPKPDHASDALAAAICHLHRMDLGRMITAAKGRLRSV